MQIFDTVSKLFNRLAFMMEAYDLGNPSLKVRDEMARQGWDHDIHVDMTARAYVSTRFAPVSCVSLIPRTPEGRIVTLNDNEDFQRYRAARTQAAATVYGMS